MYYPYLYGRQAELHAITDVIEDLGSPQAIFPLIEPVDPAKKLTSTLAELELRGKECFVVVNPNQGKLSESVANSVWKKDFAATLSKKQCVVPTLKQTDATTISDIAGFAATYPGRKIGVVLTADNLAPQDVVRVLSGSNYTVFLLETDRSGLYLPGLDPARTVIVSDNFRCEARNKDYHGDEFLGSNHDTWAAAGSPGFSDFTMLSGAFQSGGGPVGAIAVHLTYVAGSDLWIQHFVSKTNERTDPQATKFREVLNDIQQQRTKTPFRFDVSPGIRSYETQHLSGNYTNLSGNKRQQISHHIYTVAKYLGL